MLVAECDRSDKVCLLLALASICADRSKIVSLPNISLCSSKVTSRRLAFEEPPAPATINIVPVPRRNLRTKWD